MKKETHMEAEEFCKLYEVTWDQLDPIGHLRGPVLIDYVLNTQMSWITFFGYGQAQLAQAGYDPVVLKLEARYHREVLIGETVRDTPEVSGLSHDGTMWKMCHIVTKIDGEKVANVKLEGTWMNWKNRQAVAPEEELLQVLRRLKKSTNFEEMRSIIRPKEG
jgi:acyl-CoA thioester hydrolase